MNLSVSSFGAPQERPLVPSGLDAYNALHAAWTRLQGRPEGWSWTFWKHANKAYYDGSFGEVCIMCAMI